MSIRPEGLRRRLHRWTEFLLLLDNLQEFHIQFVQLRQFLHELGALSGDFFQLRARFSLVATVRRRLSRGYGDAVRNLLAHFVITGAD